MKYAFGRCEWEKSNRVAGLAEATCLGVLSLMTWTLGHPVRACRHALK